MYVWYVYCVAPLSFMHFDTHGNIILLTLQLQQFVESYGFKFTSFHQIDRNCMFARFAMTSEISTNMGALGTCRYRIKKIRKPFSLSAVILLFFVVNRIYIYSYVLITNSLAYVYSN